LRAAGVQGRGAVLPAYPRAAGESGRGSHLQGEREGQHIASALPSGSAERQERGCELVLLRLPCIWSEHVRQARTSSTCSNCVTVLPSAFAVALRPRPAAVLAALGGRGMGACA